MIWYTIRHHDPLKIPSTMRDPAVDSVLLVRDAVLLLVRLMLLQPTMLLRSMLREVLTSRGRRRVVVGLIPEEDAGKGLYYQP